MAFFFPRTVYDNSVSFNPLLHLLNEVDSQLETLPSSSQQSQQPRRTQSECPAYRFTARRWEPRFEAQETEDAFVLYGELPGLNKDHVTVEFPEPRKLVVSGKVEHTGASSSTPATNTTKEAGPTNELAAEDTEGRSSYQATVEDDDEGDDFEVLGQTSEKQKQKEAVKPGSKMEQKQPAGLASNQDTPHYIKEFSRFFNFPTYVNREAVTADMKDGLLTIVIPKAKPEPHHVYVS